MTDCPGPCNAWWRQLTTEQQDASETRPRQGDPELCHLCAARIRQVFPQLDYRAAVVAAMADGHRQHPADALRRGNGSPPSPSPLGDVVYLFTGAVYDWEDNYRQLRRLGGAMHTGDDNEIRSEVLAWLGARLTSILASPMGPHFGQEVMDWHRRLTALAKAGTGRRIMPVPCPWCGHKLLAMTAGSDYVTCINPGPPPCRCRLTIDQYKAEEHTAVRHLERAR